MKIAVFELENKEAIGLILLTNATNIAGYIDGKAQNVVNNPE
jgi:hypothetical protein